MAATASTLEFEPSLTVPARACGPLGIRPRLVGPRPRHPAVLGGSRSAAVRRLLRPRQSSVSDDSRCDRTYGDDRLANRRPRPPPAVAAATARRAGCAPASAAATSSNGPSELPRRARSETAGGGIPGSTAAACNNQSRCGPRRSPPTSNCSPTCRRHLNSATESSRWGTGASEDVVCPGIGSLRDARRHG